ncbi:LytR/AlgR family response regulator transcription factor [Fulvitalea axinellae]|uniref:LytR/AlgR family response regulator transcription factor n=1 Tax=Fulvitalea axinellae TaxID=1182444 RepID=UPI0030CA536A
MKYAIVEDEKPNARLLKMYLETLRPDWEYDPVFGTISSFTKHYAKYPLPDLIFMDIQLKDGLCFEIFNKIKVECPIIFTTAFDQYAIRAFEVNSIDYLLKPIEEDKLEQAIEKFEKLHLHPDSPQDTPDFGKLLDAIQSGSKTYRTRFMVSGPRSFFKIEVPDIAMFKSEGGVCLAYMFDGKKYVLEQTLEKLEFQLDPERFFRANRGIILNIDAVDSFEPYFGGKLAVSVKSVNEPVMVSRLKAQAFKSWVDAW